MKRIIFAAVTMSIMLALSGCGGGSSPQPTFVAQILSRPALDGDIRFDSPNVFTVTQGITPSVFAGIDPVTGSEFRAFLDFPLTGTGGVPGNAFIDSARLQIFIDSVSILPAASSVPVLIELVSYPQPLQATDYDRTSQPPLGSTAIITSILPGDVGHIVSLDVTSLMVEAQHRGLANFQIRILEDLGIVLPGLFEIDDSTINRAPLLEVTYSF